MKIIPDILNRKNDAKQSLSYVDSSLKIIDSIAFAELRSKVELTSLYLVSQGIKKGDFVLVIIKHGVSFTVFDLAISQTGAVSVPVYQNCSSDDLRFILKQVNPKLIIVNDQFAKKHSQVLGSYSLLVYNEALHFNFGSAIRNSENKAKLEKAKKLVTENDLFTVIYTSGSTGNPKGVMLSHKNVIHNVVNLAKGCYIPRGKQVLSFLPQAHIFERVFSFIYLLQGVDVIYLESAELLLPACKIYKPYAFNAAPVILHRLFEAYAREYSLNRESVLSNYAGNSGMYDSRDFLAKPDLKKEKAVNRNFRKYLGGNLHHICCGSSKMPVEAARFFIDSGIGVIEGYGMTEMSPIISYSRLKKQNKTGTVGKPLEGTTVILSEQNEILADGPGKFMGYFRNKALTGKATSGRYIKTGDLGYFDNDGFLVVTSRIADVFKLSNGRFFNPLKAEARILTLPYIHQVALLGSNKDFLLALAVLTPGKKYKVNELLKSGEEIRRVFYSDKTNKGLDLHVIFLREPFTIENGLLTPALKTKRFAVENRYSIISTLVKENAALTGLLYALFIDDATAEQLKNMKDRKSLAGYILKAMKDTGHKLIRSEVENYFSLLERLQVRKIKASKETSGLLAGKNNNCFND